MKSFLHSATFKSLWSPPAFLGTSHGDEDEMGEEQDEDEDEDEDNAKDEVEDENKDENIRQR